MSKGEAMFKAIEEVELGRYTMTCLELQALYARHNGELYNMVRDAFRYGFVKGQRAEKARAAERRRRVKAV